MKVYCQKFVALFLTLVLSISLLAQGAFAFSFADLMWTGQVPIQQLTAQMDELNKKYNVNVTIEPDSKLNQMRLYENNSGTWVVNSDGKYPWSPVKGDVPTEPGNAPAQDIAPPSISKNKFLDARVVKWSPRSIVTKDVLANLVIALGKEGITASLAQNTIPTDETTGKSAKVWYVTNEGKNQVYCNSIGWPYTASSDPSVADNNFNYIVDNSDNSTNTTVDNKVIDTSNNQMTIINENGDKVTLNIDSLYWDDSTNSYVANTYNIQNNVYNYYTYNITYNTTNTYITYIGSNSAYQQEEYKYYYELPDGRSSEDLTAEEVGAISFQFADVANYARSATDTTLRALYHFDGNTEDSGYFSTQTKFAWENNASITYMDSANFNGALYLDERTHDFNIDLPSHLGSGDFTIQWRHYQASQPDTLNNINSGLAIGGVTVLRWDESKFYMGAGSTTSVGSVPVGNWHEMALVRENGTLYFYVNGLKISSMVDRTSYQGKLMFWFGTTCRAYSMMDELRVVNFPIAKGGASYQCATAPFDTNLVLVLPDSAFPIADEYWEFNSKGNLFSGYDFSSGGLPPGWSKGAKAVLGAESDYSVLTGSCPFGPSGYPWYDYTPYGITTVFSASQGTYTMSFMDADDKITSWTFTASGIGNCTRESSFAWGFITVYFDFNAGTARVTIVPYSNKALNVRYVEFIKGAVANTGHEKVSCIYSSEEIKPNTAAVQSAIPVNGYTVGGVRPTFPVRGDVWFPVEGRRISGCYQYDGAMWRVAGCRYYTGTRWIPIYAFDIYTLADCWDVADADTVDPTPPITSEQGFWNWWKGQWKDFRNWLEKNGGGSGGGGEELPPGTLPDIPGEGEEGVSIFDVVKSIIDALWSLVTGLFNTLLGGVVGFFTSLTTGIDGFFSAFDGQDGVFGFATYGGADIWD